MSKKTRQVQVGSVRIGGGAPVSVQSMTNTDTADVEKTLSQIRALTVAGADIVRVSVYNEACADAVRALVDGSPCRWSPTSILITSSPSRRWKTASTSCASTPATSAARRTCVVLADCVKTHHIPVRIGVNSGSVEKDILAKYGGPTPQGHGGKRAGAREDAGKLRLLRHGALHEGEQRAGYRSRRIGWPARSAIIRCTSA